MTPEYHSTAPHRTTKHRAALRFGSKIPVFPCKTDKTPYTPNGFKDATTDRARINAYWNRYPDANPATPTGERGGFFVLDVDLEAWGAGSLEALEDEHGELPETFTVKTGGGGLHYYFRLPPGVEIRNSAGKLGLGLDVRGEGGYVLLPGSRTEGAYEVLENHLIADAPMWLVELLRESDESKISEHPCRQRSITNASADGPPILEGTRDSSLASIAGKLHDGTRSLPDLEADLLETNDARCVPPLPERQVRKVAKSIHKRTPCKPSPPEPDPKTLEKLAAVEAELERADWRGMGGRSMRSILVSLIKQGRRHATMTPSGAKVSIGLRALALDSALSKRSTSKGIDRLKRDGWIRRDNSGRSGMKAGAFILLTPRAKVAHSTTGGGIRKQERSSGLPLRAPYTAPRLRWSQPKYTPRRGVVRGTRTVRQGVPPEERPAIKRLGKTAEHVLDALEAAGGELTLIELAAAVGVKRTRDLRRRVLARMEEAAVIECSEDTVSLPADWLEALNLERERAGEIAAYERDMRNYNRASESYRNRHKVRPMRAPSEREMREHRGGAPDHRRGAVEGAIVRLFRERPEYRRRRVGQITCALIHYLPADFPRGLDPGGVPRDQEVAAVLEANGLEVAI